MTTRGLLVRLEAQHGKDADVEQFLRSALPLVRQEPGTTAWFAIRFGRSEYGIVDTFPDDAARQAHLTGAIARSLGERGATLFASPPRIQKFDVLAEKMPASAAQRPVTKGLVLTFKPKAGNEQGVEQFLRDAKPLVDAEPETVAWFAIHLDDGHYGIFDVFPDHGGRFAHLTGRVAQGLAKHALSLLGSLPDPELPSVLTSTFEP